MNVARIGIRELRDGLSRHLAAVHDGREIVVTDHGTPVARIIPYGTESAIERLVREGIATLPTTPRRRTYPEPVDTRGAVTDLIAEAGGRY